MDFPTTMTPAVSLVLAISLLVVVGVLSSCVPLKEDTVTTISEGSTSVINWTKQLGTSSHDYGRSITSDSSGNVYVTGTTDGALNVTNAGSSDIFVIKFK